MKKLLTVFLAAVLLLSLFSLCSCGNKEDTTVVLAADGDIQADILAFAVPASEESEYLLEVRAMTGFDIAASEEKNPLPVDGVFLKSLTDLEAFCSVNDTELVPAQAVYFEPMGIYPCFVFDLEDLTYGSVIAVPEDEHGISRALALLEKAGLIILGSETSPALSDIEENPLELELVKIPAGHFAEAVLSCDMAVMPGLEALGCGLKTSDALVLEDNELGDIYGSFICTERQVTDSDKFKAFIAAFKAGGAYNYIEDTFNGALIPMF